MFSFVFPMDSNRLEQFAVTKRLYDEMPEKKEFIILTREYDKVAKYLKSKKLDKNVRLIKYEVETGFNPSKAFNIGTREAKYDQIIITSPEVKPKTNVLTQLKELIGHNVICEVWDEDQHQGLAGLLVNSNYRSRTPAYYFLAMFNRKDLEEINGWDEDFMKGYAYEDDDFGERWLRAKLPFIFRDDIQAIHQYHARSETISGGTFTNYNKLQQNNEFGVIKCKNGLNRIL